MLDVLYNMKIDFMKLIHEYRKPASRYEVVQLKSTMEEMLDKAGINDADTEIKGPTQVRHI
jgi:hypothetical protein